MVNDTGMVEIQVRDSSGNWRNYGYSQNVSAIYKANVEQIRWQFPEANIRIVDSNGRIVDFF